eukprot:6188456-Pleurochrysis_carterae.AAC.2
MGADTSCAIPNSSISLSSAPPAEPGCETKLESMESTTLAPDEPTLDFFFRPAKNQEKGKRQLRD